MKEAILSADPTPQATLQDSLSNLHRDLAPPGSFHAMNTAMMAQTTSAPTCAPTTDAHRLTSDHPASVVASASSATAAV